MRKKQFPVVVIIANQCKLPFFTFSNCVDNLQIVRQGYFAFHKTSFAALCGRGILCIFLITGAMGTAACQQPCHCDTYHQ